MRQATVHSILRETSRSILVHASILISLAILLAFAVAPSSAQTYEVLYNFSTATGAQPMGQIAFDKAGNIYGTTEDGGSESAGTVFELSPPAAPGAAWTETVLYSFSGTDAGGYYPVGGITIDKLGNLYGTTTWGGGTRCNCGTVFKLEPPTTPGGAWSYRTLHHFGGWPSDGSDPEAPVTVEQLRKHLRHDIYRRSVLQQLGGSRRSRVQAKPPGQWLGGNRPVELRRTGRRILSHV